MQTYRWLLFSLSRYKTIPEKFLLLLFSSFFLTAKLRNAFSSLLLSPSFSFSRSLFAMSISLLALHFSHPSSYTTAAFKFSNGLSCRCFYRTNFLFPNKQRESHVRARLRKSVQFGKIELYAPIQIVRRA